MSADPTKGVVDADCRVHGLANLYIGGSSVFASTGFENPTYTIVQLALRLGDHLGDHRRRSRRCPARADAGPGRHEEEGARPVILVDSALARHVADGKAPIRVGMIGAGFMASGVLLQTARLPRLDPHRRRRQPHRGEGRPGLRGGGPRTRRWSTAPRRSPAPSRPAGRR